MTEVNEKKIDESTEEKGKIVCAWCADKTDDYNDVRGEIVCMPCFDENTFFCAECGESAHTDNSTFISSRGGYEVCDNCYHHNEYFYCEGCDNRYEDDDYGGDNLCVRCYEDNEEDENDNIRYRGIDLRTKDFQSDEVGSFIKSNRTFGVELEMVSPEIEHLKKLSQTLDYKVGVENDGSLKGGYGIEIQTPVLKGKVGETTLIDIVSKAKSCGLSVNKSCGTHVHLGAKDFVPEMETKYHVSDTDGFIRKTETENSELLGLVTVMENRNLDALLAFLGDVQLYRFGNAPQTEKVLGLPVADVGSVGNDVVELLKTLDFGNGVKDPVLIIVNSFVSPKRLNDLLTITGIELYPLCIVKDKIPKASGVEKLKTLLAFYTVYDDVFLAMISESRRGNMYCQPIKSAYTLADVVAIKTLDGFDNLWFKKKGHRGTNGGRDRETVKERKEDGHDSSRYQGINFHSLLGKRQTLEIRYHSGTLDSKKILSWVALHQKILDTISNGGITLDVLEKNNLKIRLEDKVKSFAELLGLEESLRTYVAGRINTYNK